LRRKFLPRIAGGHAKNSPRAGHRHHRERLTSGVMVLGFGAGDGQPQAGYDFQKG
jgi:hypothetical protein